MRECVFCRIVNGKMKAEIIYEDEWFTSFLDINPKAIGHTLVIPKEYVRVLTDLDDDCVCGVTLAVKKVTRMLKNAVNAEVFTIGINDGIEAGQ
jgi:histidine triad (HIT) family protein